MGSLSPIDYENFVAALKGPPGALDHWLEMHSEPVKRMCIELYAREKENAAQFNERRRQVEAQLEEWFRLKPPTSRG